MTTVHHARGADGRATDTALEADLGDLRAALATHPFPSCQDDLIAACLASQQPTRLACRLSRLPRERTYLALDEVLADVRAAALTA
ncbi:MAG: hypothetical protein ABI890_14050 [Lapillicoccus sp.]